MKGFSLEVEAEITHIEIIQKKGILLVITVENKILLYQEDDKRICLIKSIKIEEPIKNPSIFPIRNLYNDFAYFIKDSHEVWELTEDFRLQQIEKLNKIPVAIHQYSSHRSFSNECVYFSRLEGKIIIHSKNKDIQMISVIDCDENMHVLTFGGGFWVVKSRCILRLEKSSELLINKF